MISVGGSSPPTARSGKRPAATRLPAANLRKTDQKRLMARLSGLAPSGLCRPGGHSEGPSTRSHPELGRETPQRQWYCVSRHGRVGRCQVHQAHSIILSHSPRSAPLTTPAGWSSPVARQAHNLKVTGSNPVPATRYQQARCQRIGPVLVPGTAPFHADSVRRGPGTPSPRAGSRQTGRGR